MNNKTTDLILLILIIVLIGGFYLILSDISKIENSIQNLEINLKLKNENQNNSVITPKEDKESTSTDSDDNLTPVSENDLIIPTAIIFQTKSSPLLSPQTDITVSVQKLIKEKNTGIVRIYIKTYTNKADSYSALEPANLFEIINPSGQNQKPLKVNGDFDSIPPQSSMTGEIIFKIADEKDNFVISVESDKGKNYYKFDFNEQKYKEATLG